MTRRCHAITKAGKKCRAAPLRDQPYCAAHHPNRPEYTRFQPGAPVGGRPPRPRAVDVLRERFEADADAVLARLFQLVYSDDESISLRAIAETFDRVYGRPKQTAEISGPAGEPLRPAVALDDPAVLAALDVVRARLRERERDAG